MLFFTLTFMEQPPHFLEHFTIFVPTYKNKLNFFTKIPPFKILLVFLELNALFQVFHLCHLFLFL